MKIGLVSAILEDYDFKKMIDTVSEIGYECVEVACWPKAKAERRYAGVSHIDVANLGDKEAEEILSYCKEKNVEISSLAFYPNTMDGNLEKRAANIEHLYKVIDASKKLVKEIWIPIVHYAEEKKVRIAIENCPMLFDGDQWPGGQNLMTTPVIWRKVFEILDSDYIGINYDPSHFVWQMIDYIQPLYEFKDKIFHVHYKDIKLFKEKLKECGTMAYPLQYMKPKLPGLGDVDWGKYVSTLTDIGFEGYTCIEIEDKSFEGSEERVLDSLKLSLRYLRQFVI